MNENKTVTISYPVKKAELIISKAEYTVVQELYAKDLKVIAIKFIRTQFNLGLYEAKQICDVIGRNRPVDEIGFFDLIS